MSAAEILAEYCERECLRLFDARAKAWTDYSTPDRPGNHVIEGYLLKVCGCVVGGGGASPSVNEAALLKLRLDLGSVRSMNPQTFPSDPPDLNDTSTHPTILRSHTLLHNTVNVPYFVCACTLSLNLMCFDRL